VSSRGGLGGVGLYFIDIFACTLFCLALALVGARFSREQTIEVELPRAESEGVSVGEVDAIAITLRSENGDTQLYWEDEPVTLAELSARVEQEPPAALLFRLETSEFTQAVAAAHAAGVADIQLAYERGAPRSERGAVQ
jgi:biopolymer transport protein ExbD